MIGATMPARAIPAPKYFFKSGWIILLISAALMALGHFSMIFIFDEPVLFTDFTAFNILAFLILYFPFRRGEKWAWAASWMLPIVYTVTAASDLNIAAYFYSFAAACVLGLLITMRGFFLKR
jgi:hypothetical protein